MTRVLPRLAVAAVLVSPLAGCRGNTDIDSLLGTWEGTLDCASEVDDGGQLVELEYTVAASLQLDSQNELAYDGTLSTVTAYTWYGAAVEELADFTVALAQSKANGAQPVSIRTATCTGAIQFADDDEVASGCDDLSPSPPSGGLNWDGADTLSISGGACAGDLQR